MKTQPSALAGTIALAALLSTDTVFAQGPTWQPVRRQFMPNALQERVVWDPVRERAITFGGSVADCSPFGNPSIYIDETWEWDGKRFTERALLSPRPTGRRVHAITYDAGRNNMLMFGGTVSDNPYACNEVGDTWTFDGESWTNRSPANAPPARAGSAIAYDAARDRVVLFGGYDACLLVGYDDTWLWDGANWTQATPTTTPPPAPTGMAYDEARGVCVLLAGDQTWEWDGTDWTQRTTTQSPTLSTLERRSIFYDPISSKVVYVGFEVWEYDGADWTYVADAPEAFPQSGYAFFDTKRGAIVWLSRNTGAAHEWDGSQWHQFRAVSTGFRGSLAYDTNRDVIVGTTAFATWSYDGRSIEFLPATQYPPFSETQLAYDEARDRIVGVTLFGETWEYDGADWHRMTPANEPPARSYQAIVYDAARQRVVLFGGETPSPAFTQLDDTWEWDGNDWTERFPTTRPPARSRAKMAYDPVRQRVVMHGGFPGDGGQTWEWDGNDWQSTATAAAGSEDHALAFDEGLGEVVMVASGGTAPTETLRYDGSSWQLLTTDTLSAVFRTDDLVYDRARGELNLFGGEGPFGCLVEPGHWKYTSSPPADVMAAGTDCPIPGTSVPNLIAGPPVLGDLGYRIELLGDPGFPIGAIALAGTLQPISVGSCTWHLGAPLQFYPTGLDAEGFGHLALPLPDLAVLAGIEIHTQGLVAVPGGPAAGHALTRALTVTFGR